MPRCLSSPATIVGTQQGDVLLGTPGPDVIVARGGDDLLLGRGGDDLLCGGAGEDTARGGPGSDRLAGGAGGDDLTGGPGADTCLSGGVNSGCEAPQYYVSLGDSLAQGVQPDEDGHAGLTNEGYVDALFADLRDRVPGLRLMKLGCPGETTESMVDGASSLCPYPQGSQLAEAASFLDTHPGMVALVTIDVGANDLLDCAVTADPVCVEEGLSTVAELLPEILAQLRAGGGPSVPVLGMNYYDPVLAAWLLGPDWQDLAEQSVEATVALNETLEAAYQEVAAPVADVETAFSTTDFTSTAQLPGFGTVPLNVARICQWTWMCAPAPVGPDVHANAEGYEVVAGAFEAVLPLDLVA